MWKEAVPLATATGTIYVLRSKYEKKHSLVEVTEIISLRLEKDRNLVFLSDFRNDKFGRDNGELVAAIHHLHPGTVLSGGDMVVYKGKWGIEAPLKLFRQLVTSYPVYCGNGNHENRVVWERDLYGDLYEEYRDAMAAMGVHYLEDSFVFLGRDLRIAGLGLSPCFYRGALYQKAPPVPEGYMERKLGKGSFVCKEEPFTIFLAYSPLYFDSCARWGTDLTLAGYFHGDTVRISGLGGVIMLQYQFSLSWYAGDSERSRERMIISRGLGTRSINIRLNNRS